jgi:hypothetical protein
VSNLRADVHDSRHGLERIEVFREGLPAPLQSFDEGGAGDVFDALHEAYEPLPLVGCGRRKSHSAIASHDGGDSVPARRRQERIPGGLAVVMSVDVDKSGGDKQARGINVFAALAV